MKVYCKNCRMKWYCSLIPWAGSDPILTVHDYVSKNNIENCHHYRRKWWKFWIKEGL